MPTPDSDDNGNGRWRFNYRQLTIIAVIVINTLWVGWWASATTQRVEALEHGAISSDRIARIETKLDGMAADIAEIKQWLLRRQAPQ